MLFTIVFIDRLTITNSIIAGAQLHVVLFKIALIIMQEFSLEQDKLHSLTQSLWLFVVKI